MIRFLPTRFNLAARPTACRLTPRRAMTLVELLVTMAVVSVLAALILPSVKTLLVDRKSSQTAILVRNYIEAARGRAIGSGKPVAVILERLSGRVMLDNLGNVVLGMSGTANPVGTSTDPIINYATYNSCIRLSMAEMPLPITSDIIGLTSTVIDDNLVSFPCISEVLAAADTFPDPNVKFVVIRANRNTVGVLTSLFGSDTSGRPFAPIEVSFGLSETKYTVFRCVVSAPLDGLQSFTLSIARSSCAINDEQVSPPIDPRSSGLFPLTVYPKPRIIGYQNLELPKGMCVDLSLSGFGENRFLTNRDANGPFDGDYRLRFSSDWVSPLIVTPPGSLTPIPEPRELRPVYVVFNPSGTLSRVYANHETPVTSPQVRPPSSLETIDAVDDVFLHIGKIDQVIVDPSNASLPFAGNLIDPSSYIVRISATSGAVSAAPSGAIRPEDIGVELDPSWAGSNLARISQLGEFVELARRRAFGQVISAQ